MKKFHNNISLETLMTHDNAKNGSKDKQAGLSIKVCLLLLLPLFLLLSALKHLLSY